MQQSHFENGSFTDVIRRQPGRLLALTSIGFLLLLAFASAATSAAATHFQVDAPANAPAGTPVSITITALDGGNTIDDTYQGTVQFSSSDGDAALPADHTFTTGSEGDNGVFTTTVTLNTTGDQTVTATDTVDPITGTSGSIGVHGPLDHFSIDEIADQTAGVGFTVTATAEDEGNNPLGVDYTGTPALDGNLNGSARGCPGAGNPCTVSYANPPSVTNGVATWTGVTAFKAEALRNVTAASAATINITGTFTTGEPDPATVDLAAASDLGGTNTGTITTTLPTTPSGAPTNVFHGDVANGCVRHQGNLAVVVGRLPANEQWSVPGFGTVEYNAAVIEDNGVAGATPVDRGRSLLLRASSKVTWCTTMTFAQFAGLLTNIESGDVGLATDGSVAGTSNDFTVNPNEPDFIAFDQEPTLTQFNTDISPDVTVKVEDAFGNATPDEPVEMTINPDFNPPTPDGTLMGGGPIDTDSDGIATFSDLQIDKPAIGYKLDATVPTTYNSPPDPDERTATSVAFDIANEVKECIAGDDCSATGSTPNRNKATVDAFGLGGGAFSSLLGPAASAQALSARLGMTVAGGTSISLPPNTSCGSLAPIGDPFWITTFESEAGDPPSYKVVARLDKSLQKKSGATKYDICLGAINVTNPPVGFSNGDQPPLSECNEPESDVSWLTKNGQCARFFNGYFWGLVADYPSSRVNNTTGCPGSSTFPSSPPFKLFPGVYQKQKNGQDIVISLCKPAPWDGGGGWR